MRRFSQAVRIVAEDSTLTLLAPAHRLLPWSFALSLAFLSPQLLAAQHPTAIVHGTVTDSNNVVVPSATVTLTNPSTGANFSAKTDHSGKYSFSVFASGNAYTVTISATGYPRFETPAFPITAGANVEEDARLEPREPYIATLERDWHNEVLVMVEQRLPKVLVVLFFLFLLERTVGFFVNRMRRIASHDSFDPYRGAQWRTMASIIRATTYSILGFFAFLQILKLLNINIAPLLASAGIVGVGIGLAAQSLFKDIINGVFILVEDQYNVGETVKIASLTGTVEDLTLRLTRLRDADGTLYIIPNSQVATVANLSRDFAVAALNISVDASADPNRVLTLLKQIAAEVHDDLAFKDALTTSPTVSGVDNINGRALTYSINSRVKIALKDDVLRALRTRIVETFKHQGIPLGIDPANMLLLQQQKGADPTAPPSQQPIVQS